MTLTYEQYLEHDYKYDGLITAEILADTMDVRTTGKRITTFRLNVPNIIVPELLRHRQFSFSSSSARSIPVGKMMASHTFVPVWRLKGKHGMQPGSFVTDATEVEDLTELWCSAINSADSAVDELRKRGVAKELANRPLAFSQFSTIIVTSSSFSNFFSLRDHELAQAEIQKLAREMKKLYESNTPRYVTDSDSWHLPFVQPCEAESLSLNNQIIVSAARCARTSYYLPGTGVFSDVSADIKLAKKLYADRHMSPFEHVAFPMSIEKIYNRIDLPDGISSEFHRNTAGFVQLRALLEPSKYNPPQFEELRKELREAFEK